MAACIANRGDCKLHSSMPDDVCITMLASLRVQPLSKPMTLCSDWDNVREDSHLLGLPSVWESSPMCETVTFALSYFQTIKIVRSLCL
ncbi:hypothetical protein CEXT_796821 [Caerostris extrusa]|uniref:Uncharacterized protein n=1 Tax=Caerostris extrusa TaxID=172846 RepID=A0AAV4XBJ4_CAEEX|nr:hypothetical protein CEXT_796821 [Caerostris extrusa]